MIGMNKFNRRVYGSVIIKALNANYNADFTKQPRTLPNGIVYATDKALKYMVRYFLYRNYAWDKDQNSDSKCKVLYFTRHKVMSDSGRYLPMSLKESYEHLFGEVEKVIKENLSPKWMFYSFDGEKIEGALQKIKPSEIQKYYKGLDGYSPDFVKKITKYAKDADEKLKFENGEIQNVDVVAQLNLSDRDDIELFYFYIDKNKTVQKIEIDDIESVARDLDMHFFGGYNKIKILYNLLNCLDVRLFGATYTGDTNVSIHGPVQINHGVDKFKQSGTNSIYTEQIKSPVRNDKAKGGEAEMTTIGSSSKTMEAHYVHNFSINPQNLEDHLRIAHELEKSVEGEKYPQQIGLTADDIAKLQEALRCGATLYDSTSKSGVENEVLIWIELIEGSKQVIPNFTELISVERDGLGKTIVHLERVKELIEQSHIKSQIESVKIFFNNVYTHVEGIAEEETVQFLPIELVELNTVKNE
jgi:CRISPR/Cas system type I-B associated protein Csh2 (Cas7 group RAMP superfamily)